MSKVSVMIPNRRERFLAKTVDSLFKNRSDDIEVIVFHDGAWPLEPLKDRKGLVQIHSTEHVGMRGGINAMARVATGDYLLKSDGHCDFAPGWDEVLKVDCDDDWIIVPRRYRLDPEAWKWTELQKPPVDCHYLSWPFERPDDPACGLHGTIWNERARERKDIPIDEEMSSQGSCYFMKRSYWERIGPLDDVSYGTFAQEFQEVGLKCWLGGGKVMVNKNTWYAHLHKGRKYGTGYGFTNNMWTDFVAKNKMAHSFVVDYWLGNRWAERKHDFAWLIERFWPVPGWPIDWQKQYEEARQAKGAAA